MYFTPCSAFTGLGWLSVTGLFTRDFEKIAGPESFSEGDADL